MSIIGFCTSWGLKACLLTAQLMSISLYLTSTKVCVLHCVIIILLLFPLIFMSHFSWCLPPRAQLPPLSLSVGGTMLWVLVAMETAVWLPASSDCQWSWWRGESAAVGSHISDIGTFSKKSEYHHVAINFDDKYSHPKTPPLREGKGLETLEL